MAITLGAEMALSMHFDEHPSYADVENALVGAGFEDYTIMRSVNTYDGSSEVQVYVRGADGNDGEPLDAQQTLTALADAVSALNDAGVTRAG